MTKLVKKAAAPVSAGISYQRTAEGWGFHPLGIASKPSKRTGEVWVNFTVGKIRDPQMLALIARHLELKEEEKKVLEAFGQRATELKLLTLPARASFFGLSRDPKSKFGLRPRDEGASIEDADDGMFI